MDPPIQTEYFLSGGAPPWLPLPSRSRSLLLPRGSTPSGSEDPSWPPSPPSSRCGSPSRSTTSAAHPLSTASASKCFSWENLKKIFQQQIKSKSTSGTFYISFLI